MFNGSLIDDMIKMVDKVEREYASREILKDMKSEVCMVERAGNLEVYPRVPSSRA